jgi:hypothetical protein
MYRKSTPQITEQAARLQTEIERWSGNEKCDFYCEHALPLKTRINK